ncbi:MAG: hypothetical protein MUE50_21740 [Pirellulaceae bacterium]|jgi:hypothetical protein|nr:hypothetical protein [Pirellulaceae bacterium]MCU0982591.1 hypothetical protein [Pirellulaceae bacterium]
MRKPLLVVVCIAAAQVLTCVAAGWAGEEPREFKLDHFLVYAVKVIGEQPTERPPVVQLKGQFDRQPKKATVNTLTFFANPVSKNGARILDPNAHLAWYAITQESEPTRRVEVRNQFGSRKLTIGPAEFLLVPAQKRMEGGQFPSGLDHFKCYQVLDGKPVDKNVSLKDQFAGDKNVPVLRPRWLAVPVQKTYKEETTKIQNKRDHLVVYEIPRKESQKKLVMKDQFGNRRLESGERRFLCVPSTKTVLPAK